MDERSSRIETDNSHALFCGYVLTATRLQARDLGRPWTGNAVAPNNKVLVDPVNNAGWISQTQAEEYAEGLAREHAAVSGHVIPSETRADWKAGPYGA